jgi:hypothetical protein
VPLSKKERDDDGDSIFVGSDIETPPAELIEQEDDPLFVKDR